MSAFYHFFNKTKDNEYNVYSIFACGCSNFVSGFDKYDIDEKTKIFETVMKINEWSNRDTILAVSDDHTKYIFKYTNGKMTIDNNYKYMYYDEYEDMDLYEMNENNKRKRIDVN